MRDHGGVVPSRWRAWRGLAPGLLGPIRFVPRVSLGNPHDLDRSTRGLTTKYI
jgi:hypothetical protein